MHATITKRLYGCRDGALVPTWHEPGDVVTGELAAAAVSTDHAEEIKPAPATKKAAGPAAGKSDPGPSANK